MKQRSRSRKGKLNSRPGARLRSIRERLGLTFREVHAVSLRLVKEFHQPAFEIQPSRLHDVEVKEVVPSIYRIYALACAYGRSLGAILALYGIPPVSRKRSPQSSAKKSR